MEQVDGGSLAAEVAALRSAQSALEARQAELSDAISLMTGEVRALRSVLDEFIHQDWLRKNVADARDQIIVLNQEIDARFGHYREIRRLATGILKALDMRAVTHDSLQFASEQQMLVAPGYWLGPALVALAAWIRDDQILSEQALDAAMQVGGDEKTALFFALVMARHRRDAAAATWLKRVVSEQDPRRLPRELAVVVDAAVADVLGPQARPFAVDHVVSWFERMSADGDAVAGQIARWRAAMLGQASFDAKRYGVLSEVSPAWESLSSLGGVASAFGAALEYFESTLAALAKKEDDLKRDVDNILDNLVSISDAQEAPYDQRLRLQKAVVKAGGDIQEARATVEQSGDATDGHVDFLTMITDAALRPREVGVSRATQQISVALARDWIIAAVRDLALTSAQQLPDKIPLELGPWKGSIGWQTDPNEVRYAVDRAIGLDIKRRMRGIRFGVKETVILVAGVLAVLTGLFIAVGGGLLVIGLLIAAGGLTAGVFSAWTFSQLQPRRAALAQEGKNLRMTLRPVINQVFNERDQWRQAWDDGSAKAQDLEEFLMELPEAGILAEESDRLVSAAVTMQRRPRPIAAFGNDLRHSVRPPTVQGPGQDSSGRLVALRLPDWDLLPSTV